MDSIPNSTNWFGEKPKIPTPFTLQDLVDDYMTNPQNCKYSPKKVTSQKGHCDYLDALKCINDFICGEPDNEDAPKKKPYHINSHQRYFRFPSRHNHIKEAADKLKNLKGQYKDFEELRETVKEMKCKGFGDTTLYDFCLRFGWHQNPKIEPKEFVYVHSKPKEAADKLKEKGYLKVGYDFKIPFDAFPEEITTSGMTAADVEHFLCCYKELIEQLPNK